MRIASKAFIAIALSSIATAPLSADEFPGRRPIELTVMFGAGSAADVTARRLADGMAKDLNATIPVINRTGAGGALGYGYVSRQQPDGHSMVWNSNSISTTYHMGLLSFDYTAFDPVARVSVETPVIVVRADAPWKTLPQLLDHAKKNPGELRVGNSGTGSHTHFAATALFIKSGGKVIDVPFGDGQAPINLLASRIEAIVQLPAAVVGQVQSGEFRVLAALGSKRDPIFPDAPTAQELRGRPGDPSRAPGHPSLDDAVRAAQRRRRHADDVRAERLADLRAGELRAQGRDLRDGEGHVGDARGGDVALELGHVELVLAQAGVDRVEALGLQAVQLLAGIGGGHLRLLNGRTRHE